MLDSSWIAAEIIGNHKFSMQSVLGINQQHGMLQLHLTIMFTHDRLPDMLPLCMAPLQS